MRTKVPTFAAIHSMHCGMPQYKLCGWLVDYLVEELEAQCIHTENHHVLLHCPTTNPKLYAQWGSKKQDWGRIKTLLLLQKCNH